MSVPSARTRGRIAAFVILALLVGALGAVGAGFVLGPRLARTLDDCGVIDNTPAASVDRAKVARRVTCFATAAAACRRKYITYIDANIDFGTVHHLRSGERVAGGCGVADSFETGGMGGGLRGTFRCSSVRLAPPAYLDLSGCINNPLTYPGHDGASMSFGPNSPPTPPPPVPVRYRGPPLAVPRDFAQACALEPGVCVGAASGSLPAELTPPLHLPRVAGGGNCPVTSAAKLAGLDIPLLAIGAAPVHVVLPVDAGGIVRTGRSGSDWSGGFKTFFVSETTYQGPFRVRGARLDGPGDIAFGLNPILAEVLVPSGPTREVNGGYRVANLPIFVTTGGCYALQVDSMDRSDVAVFKVVTS